MAENQSFENPKQEQRQREHTQQEKPPSEQQNTLSSTSLSDVSSSKSVFRDQSSQLETLTVLPPILSSENGHESDCPSFSQLLAGAMASPASNSSQILSSGGLDAKPTVQVVLSPSGFKGQFGMSHQEVLASVTAQAQAQMQLHVAYPSSSSELLPVSLIQSISSTITPTPLKQELSPVSEDDNVCTPEADEQNSSDQKAKPAHVIMKTPSTDGYNWRKYGQKQVKTTDSSRSYYKCTFGNCHAKKKVECCDHSGRIIEIIYKGQHNHDPPQKIRCTKASGFVTPSGSVSSAGSGGGSGTIECPVSELNNLDASRSRLEPIYATPEKKLNSLSECSRDAHVRAAEDQGDEPYPKRRMKDGSVAYSNPQFKTVKEPKIVVQAAGDVGISGDGFRWRKYGQKMVKGNPNPRSYYKCTSAGCPVRKHVERAIEDTTTIIITYEGKHDHDMPVPKKRHGPPSTALLIAAAAAMNSTQLKTSEALVRKPKTKWPMENDQGELAGERAIELGGEKVLESARTLLSIGIELKPY